MEYEIGSDVACARACAPDSNPARIPVPPVSLTRSDLCVYVSTRVCVCIHVGVNVLRCSRKHTVTDSTMPYYS